MNRRNSEQFQLRMPDGMRERIRTAAESNDRSMNAEIVATLEEKYPAPSPLYVRDVTGLYMGVLHWSEDQGDWTSLDWDVWTRFRSKDWDVWIQDSALDPAIPAYPGFPEGKNYFVVLVSDTEDDVKNLIPHYYELDSHGNVVGTVFDVLTEEEREAFKRMMVASTSTPAEDRYYSELCGKMNPHLRPPAYTIPSLRDKIKRSCRAPNLDKLLKEREYLS
ncbi:MAG: Arc family DNA-binding protein [Aurantimonas endophytica]|uniref:Arc family DNA-binding protein n=1 Tax=Aurantimonas endophytica TaxID=1522175 RepID=UPI003002AB85